MSKRRDSEWRNLGASSLLTRFLSGREIRGPALVMGDPVPDVVDTLTAMGLDVMVWDRRAFRGKTGKPWPPPGPFQLAALRLPRGKQELSMSLHAAASVLEIGGPILVYGAKDEGIQGALGPLGDLFMAVETVAIGNHCRVLRGTRGPEVPGHRARLADWKCTVAPDHPGLPEEWVSFPGVFAHGRLDDGTRFLLDSLPPLPPGARVLDYGCGTGVVGFAARGCGRNILVELLDVDSVALAAARENVPGSPIHLLDGLPSVEVGPFDAIFSNPPFHRGKVEDPEMVRSLVTGSPALLQPRGILVFVAQRRLLLEESLSAAFRKVSILAENSTFRVWKGETPKKVSGKR